MLSCSDDPEEIQLTFLEKNNQTEWTLSDADLEVYIRINNDKAHLIEQWRYIPEMECYEYNENIFVPGDYQILENSENRFVVCCDPILGDCDELIFHLEGQALQVDVKVSEWEEETVHFYRCEKKLDELKICDEEVKEDWVTNSWPVYCGASYLGKRNTSKALKPQSAVLPPPK